MFNFFRRKNKTIVSELTINSLDREFLKGVDFLKSAKASKLKLDNTPNHCQLTCGMKLADKCQELQEKTGLKIKLTSGFRSEEVNKAVGGSPTSKHMQFLAIDFLFKDKTPKETVELVRNSGVSIDKCFVERSCAHVQICMNDKDNQNFFGTAEKVNGSWKVTNKIKDL